MSLDDVPGRVALLRPVVGPGEDRNEQIRDYYEQIQRELRPVVGPGEDRNRSQRAA